MTTSKPKSWITDEMLDQIVGDADPAEMFQSGELMAELRMTVRTRHPTPVTHHSDQGEQYTSNSLRVGLSGSRSL